MGVQIIDNRQPSQPRRIDYEGACIIWSGSVDDDGYGYLYLPEQMKIHRGRRTRAHRHEWEKVHGPLDAKLQLHHKCETKACVNVNHLIPLTRAEHQRIHKANPTHCRHGHKYTIENTRMRKTGYRCCRTCEKLRQRPGGLEKNL